MHYRGQLFRAINPIYARDPLSGHGAELHGGRFNPQGTPALYLSLSLETALREANQSGSLQPTVIVGYEADIEKVFDSRDPDAYEAFAMAADGLGDDGWRDHMVKGGIAPTQQFAIDLIARGYHGLLVQSFAPGTSKHDLNLVLWRWGSDAPARLAYIDDEQRLKR